MTAAAFDVYVSSHDGHSLRVATHIMQRLGLGAYDYARLGATPPVIDPSRPVLLVAPVRYGVHTPETEAFLKALMEHSPPPPLVFVSVNLTARKEGRQTVETNAYLKKCVDKFKLKPVAARAVAGVLDYPKYKWLDRQLIRMIMKMSKGPTGGWEVIEYTDWDDVDEFCDALPAPFGRMAQAAE
jgi:menaquinone-dependent protoporphyrinogen oxidase